LTEQGFLQRTDKPQPPFDAVLKRGLDRQRRPGGDDCPDAAALAAYYERSLPLSQSSRLEEHFSNCARCQSALAAIARAQTPRRAAPPRAFARRWELYAALAAGVAGISIVAGLMRTAHHPITTADIVSRNELAAPAQVRQKSEPTAKETGPLIALNEPAPLANPAAEAPSADQPERKAAKGFGSSVLAPRRLLAKEAKPGNIELRSPEFSYPKSAGAFRAQPGPPGAVSQRRPATAKPRLMDQGAPATAPPSPSVATSELGNAPSFAPGAPVPAPAANLATAESASSSAPVAGFGGGSPSAAPAGRIAAGERRLEMVSIRTADNVERWRLGARGTIEHRASDGQWLRQNSGVSTDLTAGAAPSPTVCWAVGAGGTIVRTADGEHWQRLDSPTSANLVAVSAIDAASAVVTAADGRRFTTSDAGRTWRPM
jgi:hypothetical protein